MSARPERRCRLRRGRKTRLFKWALAGLAAIAAHVASERLRYNRTPSVPTGLYWISPSESLAVGNYVAFCPPDNDWMREARERGYLGYGTCPGAYPSLLKVVVAEAGDHVLIDEYGIHVGGRLVPHSAPLQRDARGRTATAKRDGHVCGPKGTRRCTIARR